MSVQSLTTPESSDFQIPDPRPSAREHIVFGRSEGFFEELKRRVDAYFNVAGRRRRDCPEMYLKTGVILAYFVAVYVLLVFVATTWWMVVPLAALMGLAVAGIGFNIQHDGAHKAYSDHQWVNKLMSLGMDMIGGSSYLWNVKHNKLHHTYPNVVGQDDDIDVGILARLAPGHEWRPFHRFQCVYMWMLYGFMTLKWQIFDDFYQIARARIGPHKIPRPKGLDLLTFFAGKAVFFSLAFGIPMLRHPVLNVIGTYLLSGAICGVVLATVFQLAHCVDVAEFPMPKLKDDDTSRLPTDWAVHQVLTTVDFARRNKVLCWVLGGLNFQVEHHLFHRICHIHYPALSKVVEETCREYGIPFLEHKSIRSAIASHVRWLVAMGQQPALA